MDKEIVEYLKEGNKIGVDSNKPPLECSGILNRAEILRHIVSGDIIISPFDAKNLGNNSYDISLGEYYWTTRQADELGLNLQNTVDKTHIKISDPYDVSEIPLIWYLKKAIYVPDYSKLLEKYLSPISLLIHVENKSKIIIVNPGDHILAHTREFIGGKRSIFGCIGSRSSTRRVGGEVCRDAGIGDIGYCSVWTLEISNSTDKPLLLVVGNRYGQIMFNKCVGPVPDRMYGENDSNNKYQQTTDLSLDRDSWTPYKMLPKKFLDREVLPIFNKYFNKNIFDDFNPMLTFDKKLSKFVKESEIFKGGYFFVVDSMFLDICDEISREIPTFVVHKNIIDFAYHFQQLCSTYLHDGWYDKFNYQMFSQSVFIPKLYICYKMYILICARYLSVTNYMMGYDKHTNISICESEEKLRICTGQIQKSEPESDRFYQIPEYISDPNDLIYIISDCKYIITGYVLKNPPFCVRCKHDNSESVIFKFPFSNVIYGVKDHLQHFLRVLTDKRFFAQTENEDTEVHT